MSATPSRFPCQLSKLAFYLGKSTAFYALQHIHDELVKAYGIDDTEQIRKLEDSLRTIDPSDSALDEYESCSNPSYATFLREILRGTIKVATFDGFLKLVYARQPTRPHVLQLLRTLHADLNHALFARDGDGVKRFEADLRKLKPREQEIRTVIGELEPGRYAQLLRRALERKPYLPRCPLHERLAKGFEHPYIDLTLLED